MYQSSCAPSSLIAEGFFTKIICVFSLSSVCYIHHIFPWFFLILSREYIHTLCRYLLVSTKVSLISYQQYRSRGVFEVVYKIFSVLRICAVRNIPYDSAWFGQSGRDADYGWYTARFNIGSAHQDASAVCFVLCR